jgi:hypothetical protein
LVPLPEAGEQEGTSRTQRLLVARPRHDEPERSLGLWHVKKYTDLPGLTGCGEGVDPGNKPTVVEKPFAKVGSDEPGSTGYEDVTIHDGHCRGGSGEGWLFPEEANTCSPSIRITLS